MGARGPWALTERLGPIGVAALLGTLMGTSGMGSAAAAVAVPQIVAHYDVPEGHGVWVLAAYTLTVAVGTALYGRLGDSRGIRGPLGFGVVLLAAGGVLAALAPTYGVLVVARLLQGAGAAAAPTLTIAALQVLYPATVRVRASAVLVGTSVGVSALGPALGGVLTEHVGWQCTVLFPAAGLLGLALLWPVIPRGGSGEALDYLGAVLVAAVAGGAILLVQSPVLGPAAVVGGLALVLAGLPLVVRQVRRRPSGFLPRAVLERPEVLAGAVGASSATVAYFGLLVVVPAVLVGEGWGPVGVGLLMLPGAVLGVLASFGVAPVVRTLGAGRTVTVAAFFATAAVLVSLASLWVSPWGHLLALGLAYVGYSFGQPAMGAVVHDGASRGTSGVALGLATLVFFGGGSLGAAVAGLGAELGWAAGLVLLALVPAGLGLLTRRRLAA
ncbi:MFS transporter [Nocardioides campestrisoli]|uniref:MFS transporter n=1 Tax=Nocardioides campestrisoli TaxID=2736757 RepID=UPI00163D6489|nr:MFS transporter [Nocardioides campestrisoli]